jgi:hypothetical protein
MKEIKRYYLIEMEMRTTSADLHWSNWLCTVIMIPRGYTVDTRKLFGVLSELKHIVEHIAELT